MKFSARKSPKADRGYGASFGPTLRLAGLGFLATLFSWLSFLEISGFGFWLIADLALLVVALVDLAISPRCRQLNVQRQVPEILPLGVDSVVALTISNTSASRLVVEVRDEPPNCVDLNAPALKGYLEPYGEATVQYSVVPGQRGDHYFNGITFRYVTRWGLWRWQVRVSRTQLVKVYPNITLLKRHFLLSHHHRLHETGVKKTYNYGRGAEFDRVRDYTPDDEPRQVNWTATARRGRLMVNQYQEQRNEAVMLMIDAGRLGAAYIGSETRLDHAINAALLLAYTALTHGDQIGCLVFADEVMAYLPPGRGGRQLRLLTKALYSIRPRFVEANYQNACLYLRRYQYKRSLVCMFSDLVEAETATQLGLELKNLRPHHLPLCVAVMDPELDNLAAATAGDSSQVYLKAAAMQVLNSRSRVAQTLQRQGVITLDAPPSRINALTINMYLDIKARAKL